MASLNEKVKEESTRNRLKSELEIKLANIFYAQGNFERVIQILDGDEPSNYSSDLKIIMVKAFAQLGKYLLTYYTLDVILNKTKGTLVHEREQLTLLMVCFEYRL